MFYAGTLGYFAEYGAFAQLSAQQQKNHMSLAPSAGTYGYEPHVTYFFGIPRTIEPGGVVMDLDRVVNITNTDGKGHDAWKDFNFQLGGLSSALEHGIPEQMFVTPENPGEAVSAIKALAKATQQGQRIYHITSANQATVLPNIHHNDLTMSEIRNALSIGKEVITHTDAISVPGWSGAGYVIFDPNTGDGAWKIGGGENGEYISPGEEILLGISLAALAITTLWLLAVFLIWFISILPTIFAALTEFAEAHGALVLLIASLPFYINSLKYNSERCSGLQYIVNSFALIAVAMAATVADLGAAFGWFAFDTSIDPSKYLVDQTCS